MRSIRCHVNFDCAYKTKMAMLCYNIYTTNAMFLDTFAPPHKPPGIDGFGGYILTSLKKTQTNPDA